jgi:hypothetical protein
MDFRKLHVIIGELELDNIKLASKGDKKALNILALTQAFRIIEHKYRKRTECINCGSKNTQIEIICNDCANIEPREGIDLDLKNGKLPKFDVSNSYCGEQGEENMKADIKEIMHAAGDKFVFLRLCNEAKEELDEAAFDLDQESRMNGV